MSGFHLAALYLWGLFICSIGLFLYLCVLSHRMNIPCLSIPLLIFLPLFFSLKFFLSWLSFLFPPCLPGTGRLTPCERHLLLHFLSPLLSLDPNGKDPRTEHAPGTECSVDSWVAGAADGVWASHGTERWPQHPASGDTSSPSSLLLCWLSGVCSEVCWEDCAVRKTLFPMWLS